MSEAKSEYTKRTQLTKEERADIISKTRYAITGTVLLFGALPGLLTQNPVTLIIGLLSVAVTALILWFVTPWAMALMPDSWLVALDDKVVGVPGRIIDSVTNSIVNAYHATVDFFVGEEGLLTQLSNYLFGGQKEATSESTSESTSTATTDFSGKPTDSFIGEKQWEYGEFVGGAQTTTHTDGNSVQKADSESGFDSEYVEEIVDPFARDTQTGTFNYADALYTLRSVGLVGAQQSRTQDTISLHDSLPADWYKGGLPPLASNTSGYYLDGSQRLNPFSNDSSQRPLVWPTEGAAKTLLSSVNSGWREEEVDLHTNKVDNSSPYGDTVSSYTNSGNTW